MRSEVDGIHRFYITLMTGKTIITNIEFRKDDEN
jgi:hypothetical protein